MNKVLIIDDEKLIRITIKNLINWEEYGMEVVGLAKDGVEGLEMIELYKPQIVITDLKMPRLDGIELIKKAKEMNKDIQILVLSNYNDYDLVRTAMKEGAFDYLLKVTLEDEELIKALQQIKQNIESIDVSARNSNNDLELTRLLLMGKNNDKVYENEFMVALSKNCHSLVSGDYQLAYFRIDDINVLYKDERIKNRTKLRNNINDIIRDALGTNNQYKMIFIKNHSGLLILKCQASLKSGKLLNNIIKNIKQYLGLEISITLSNVVTGVEKFTQTYLRLLETHDFRFYVGNASVIDIAFMPVQSTINRDDFSLHLKLVEAIKEKDFVKAKDIKDEILLYAKDHYVKPNNVKEVFLMILNNIEAYEANKGLKNVSRFTEYHDDVLFTETSDALSSEMDKILVSIELWLKDDANLKYRREIVEVIDFVDANIDKKITLTMIAAAVNMNESYLSRTFKTETGDNLINFINERKMKKAMELLLDSKVMIKEVAYLVGIDDQFYFNKVFKRYNNISPSDFRKQYMSGKRNK